MSEQKQPAEGSETAKKGGIMALLTKLPVLLGWVMVIEAAVLVGGMKMLGGGAQLASGAELTAEEGGHGGGGEHGEAGAPAGSPDGVAEVKVVGFRAPNKVSGKTFIYDVEVCLLTRNKHKEKIESIIIGNPALIQDRIRTIIAMSDPEKLGGGSEPGLETFRRQVKHQLDEIVGHGLIDEVLVPKCIPFRTDF